MDANFKIPFYAKVALIAICVYALIFTMCIGREIILPLIYATIIAILLNPVVNFLMRKGVNKIVAISITVVFSFLLVLAIIYVISSQMTMFSETLPQLKVKITEALNEGVHWVAEKFKISEQKIQTKIQEGRSEAMNNLAVGEKITQVGRIVMVGTLLPVYLFMILFYKPLLLEFIKKLFPTQHHKTVSEVLISTKTIIHSYLVGLLFEMIIIAVLNSVGLLILGIQYAILLGVLGAILNVIPYIGGVMATSLPMIIAFVTKDSITYPLIVMIMYIVIQFVDNHYIVPKIVASRVKINALISIIVVLIGGAIWGVPGMFLSIPLTAILKVIFDHIEPLKPWGFLLGNIVPTTSSFTSIKVRKAKAK
ncbi:MAG: AI-2E family transporter [Bacteroidia bacterium]